MAKMTVYHGSYQKAEQPKLITGRNTKDFGTGFYCTIIKEQAQRWAKRYDTPVVSIYEVRLDTGLDILDFREMTVLEYGKVQVPDTPGQLLYGGSTKLPGISRL